MTKTPSPRPADDAMPAAGRPRVTDPRLTPVSTRTPVTPPPATYKPPPGPTIPPGKPVRKVPNPELEGTDVPSVAPMPRRAVSLDIGQKIGQKKKSRSSWIVTGAVALLGLLIVAGTISWWQERRAAKAAARAAAEAAAAAAPAREMTPERQAALDLLMRDDAASLERAAAQLDELVRRSPASAARADRALALALLSQQALDQAERLESQAALLDEQRATAAAARGGAARARELAIEVETARAEVLPLRERAARLLREARAELDATPSQLRDDLSTTRARAWVALASGARGDAARTAREAPGGGGDPWLDLAGAIAELPEGADGAALERFADRLEQLAEKHRGFVRPLYLAGRIRAGLGDGERAIADLDGALRASPLHADARRLRAELGPMPEEPAPSEGGAPGAAGREPRR